MSLGTSVDKMCATNILAVLLFIVLQWVFKEETTSHEQKKNNRQQTQYRYLATHIEIHILRQWRQ